MPGQLRQQDNLAMDSRYCWHPYELQRLGPVKFGLAVGRILRGQQGLVMVRGTDHPVVYIQQNTHIRMKEVPNARRR